MATPRGCDKSASATGVSPWLKSSTQPSSSRLQDEVGSRVDNLYLEIMIRFYLAGKPHPLGKLAGVQAYCLIHRGFSGIASCDPYPAHTAGPLTITTRADPNVGFIQDMANRTTRYKS